MSTKNSRVTVRSLSETLDMLASQLREHIDNPENKVHQMQMAYKYHCDAPISGLDAAMAEHDRCTELWDDLVDVHIWHAKAVEAAAARDDETVRDLLARVPQMFSAAHAAEGDERKSLFAAAREARAELWRLLKAWRKAHMDEVRALERERQAKVKALRQSTTAYWGNYNSVIARHEAARQVCAQTGRKLRYHDDDRDDGELVVQIQRTATGLGAAPNELQLSQLNIVPIPADARKRITLVTMRVDREGNTVTLPLLMDRPLPPCRVKSAKVCWSRIGSRMRWSLILQLSDVEPEQQIAYRAPGTLALCYESYAGGIKVATRGDRHYVLPPRWCYEMTRNANRQRWLNESLKAIREANPQYAEAWKLPHHKMLDWLKERDRLREWRRDWKRVWECWHHTRRQLIDHRTNLYWQWAREIVRETPQLTLEDLPLAKIARQDRGSETNSLRQRACLHQLRACIVHQANKIGAEVIASGRVLTHSGERKSSAWARRKAGKAERSQKESVAGAGLGVGQ